MKWNLWKDVMMDYGLYIQDFYPLFLVGNVGIVKENDENDE